MLNTQCVARPPRRQAAAGDSGAAMTDSQSRKDEDSTPSKTGQPAKKAAKPPKPRKVEKRQKGRKG